MLRHPWSPARAKQNARTFGIYAVVTFSLAACDMQAPEPDSVALARSAPQGTQLLVASGLPDDGSVAVIYAPGKGRFGLISVLPGTATETQLFEAAKNVCRYHNAALTGAEMADHPVPGTPKGSDTIEFRCA